MFESLTNKMSDALRKMRGLHELTEANIEEALGEVRTALLGADVHFKVVRNFIDTVKTNCLGEEVLKSVSPGQQMVKVIHDELVTLLGEGVSELASNKPLRTMLVGLHGSGKTTTAAKLALRLKSRGYKPALVACDLYRPAAIDQLEALGKQINVPVFSDRSEKQPIKVGKNALQWAEDNGYDAVIWDTAGRLQIDDDLVQEVKDLRELVNPQEVLLVADAALGHEAVSVAETFHQAVNLSGIVLTKLDGDARGGAAVSMKTVTGVPIKLIGTGEKVSELEGFHPDRMAGRILGMGDVVSLVEKAQESMGEEKQKKMAEKFKKAEFDFNDFLDQLQQIKKMGSIASLAKMVPGMGKMKVGSMEEQQMKRTEAIILSMTPKERANPKIFNGSRRLRVATGAGVKVKDINQLLKMFQQMKKMMKSMKGAKGAKMQQQMAAMAEMGGMDGMPDLAKLKGKLPF